MVASHRDCHRRDNNPVSDKTRIIRGGTWGAALQERLATSTIGTSQWMQEQTRLLKDDINSRVGLLQLRSRECCLKLYVSKSARQNLLFRLGQGRAVRSFDIAYRLTAARVPVPEPLACLRVPEGMLLLTQGLAGSRNLNEIWREQGEPQEPAGLLQAAGVAVARLHRGGYAHGDCKWSNLLWDDQQCYLVDLDDTRKAPLAGVRQARDLARFTLNAEELGITAELYALFLGSYLHGTGASRDSVVTAMLPWLETLRQRHSVKYGERGHRLF